MGIKYCDNSNLVCNNINISILDIEVEYQTKQNLYPAKHNVSLCNTTTLNMLGVLTMNTM